MTHESHQVILQRAEAASKLGGMYYAEAAGLLRAAYYTEPGLYSDNAILQEAFLRGFREGKVILHVAERLPPVEAMGQ